MLPTSGSRLPHFTNLRTKRSRDEPPACPQIRGRQAAHLEDATLAINQIVKDRCEDRPQSLPVLPRPFRPACNQQGPPGSLEPGRSLLTALATPPLGVTPLKSAVNIAITPKLVKGGGKVFFEAPSATAKPLCEATPIHPGAGPRQATCLGHLDLDTWVMAARQGPRQSSRAFSALRQPRRNLVEIANRLGDLR